MSSLCFHISERKSVGSFHMKSYRSSSTFVMVDLLFHELLPFIQNSFSGLSQLWFHISEWKFVSSNSNCYLLKSTPKKWLLIWICLGRWGTCIAFRNTLSMLVILQISVLIKCSIHCAKFNWNKYWMLKIQAFRVMLPHWWLFPKSNNYPRATRYCKADGDRSVCVCVCVCHAFNLWTQ